MGLEPKPLTLPLKLSCSQPVTKIPGPSSDSLSEAGPSLSAWSVTLWTTDVSGSAGCFPPPRTIADDDCELCVNVACTAAVEMAWVP